MQLTEAAFEQAEALAERERLAGVRRAQIALVGDGHATPLVCDCGSEIAEARRRAVPGTKRCYECAVALERGRRRA